MYEIFAISPAYPGRINMWFERRKPGNTSAFTPGFRPRGRHPRCRGRCPRICGADKVLEDEDDRDLSVCRVPEVDVLVDENRDDVDGGPRIEEPRGKVTDVEDIEDNVFKAKGHRGQGSANREPSPR